MGQRCADLDSLRGAAGAPDNLRAWGRWERVARELQRSSWRRGCATGRQAPCPAARKAGRVHRKQGDPQGPCAVALEDSFGAGRAAYCSVNARERSTHPVLG